MNAGASTPTKHSAFPEWLTRKDDDAKAWTVHEGTPTRGDAWTNLTACEMKVPFGDDEISRAVRAHEMVHAKVSPKVIGHEYAASIGVELDTLIVAEEFRVNMLAVAAGFDMNNLRDGSETLSGEIAARNKDWNGAVRMLTATAGTKGASDFLRGVAKHDPEMARLLRKVQNELKKMWRNDLKNRGTKRIGSTNVKQDGCMPDGFHEFTGKYAKYVQRLIRNEDSDSQGDDDEPAIPTENEIKRGNKSGSFARLIELKVPKPVKVDGRIGRKRVATDIGRNPRRINRLLTDPDKRVFDKRTRGKGGVVLIDQSGSMHLEDDDIWKIIEHAPGCVIIGYSHRPGSTDTPNVWVIAERGRVAESVPNGNSGNGVDGPAIRFAAKHLRTGEPFIWVCDGIVTDGASDHPYANLYIECADLVKKHRIHMVEDVEEAVNALKRAARGDRLPRRFVGSLTRHDTPDE